MKNKKTTLRKELLLLCFIAFIISFSVYKIGCNLAVHMISKYYNTEHHIEYLEKNIYRNFKHIFRKMNSVLKIYR